VPKGDVPGEWYSPTQPFPTKPPPLQRIDAISPDEVNPYVISPEERARFRDLIANARNEGIYTPPALDRWAIHRPGHSGGSNLYSTSSDPTNGTVYIASWGGPSVLKLETTEAAIANNSVWGPRRSDAVFGSETGSGGTATSASVQQGRVAYEETCQSCHGTVQGGGSTGGAPLAGVVARLSDEVIRSIALEGQGRMPALSSMSGTTLSALIAYMRNPGTSAVRREVPYPTVEVPVTQRLYSGYGFAPLMLAPPWSTYTAYDMNTGTIKWRIPVGDAVGPSLSPGNNFGEAMIHGPKSTLAITAGGLAFAGTRDRKLRAYDKETGKVLWSADLPGPSMGVPSIYEVDGRQHVVVHAIGSWIAYALPSKQR
jgi:quinoprotein glucose dehydrogenase